MMKTILDPTFDKLASEAAQKAHEAVRTFYSLRLEERTPKAADAAVRALKEAGAPLQQYVRIQRMRAKATKLIECRNFRPAK